MQDMTESFVKMNGLEEPIFNLLYEMLLLYIDFRFYIISFGLRIFSRDGLLLGQNSTQNLTRWLGDVLADQTGTITYL